MTPTNLRSPAILVPGLFLLTLLGLLLALATIDNLEAWSTGRP